MLRELGPVVVALLLCGRIGSMLTTEVGVMVVTNQLDSLTMAGIDYFGMIMMPRWLACILVTPILNTIFCLVAMIAAMAFSIFVMQMDCDNFYWKYSTAG